MIVLIKRSALQAMPPSDITHQPQVTGPAAFVPLQELKRVVGESSAFQKVFYESNRLRTALGNDLLKAVAVALNILHLTQPRLTYSEEESISNVKAWEVLGGELRKLGTEEKRLSESCGDILSRLWVAIEEIRSVAGLRLELDLAMGLEVNDRAANESLKVNEAGDVALKTLSVAIESLGPLQSD